MAIRKCDSVITAGECSGHLGKFDSCRDEALHTLTLDFGSDDSFGDVDFEGYFTRVTLTDDQTVALTYGPTVTVPAGDYVVQSVSSGVVYVYDFDPTAWERASAAYEAWDSPEWCDDCTFDQRCQTHADMLAANT